MSSAPSPPCPRASPAPYSHFSSTPLGVLLGRRFPLHALGESQPAPAAEEAPATGLLEELPQSCSSALSSQPGMGSRRVNALLQHSDLPAVMDVTKGGEGGPPLPRGASERTSRRRWHLGSELKAEGTAAAKTECGERGSGGTHGKLLREMPRPPPSPWCRSQSRAQTGC